MVRNKKLLPLGVPAASSPRKHKDTLDYFVSSQPEHRTASVADKMAPGSPSAGSAGTSAERENREDTLTLIRQELAAISDRMLSKTDTGGLIQELRAAVREELAALRTDLTVVEVRVDALETEAQTCQMQHRATELATTRQGNLLLTLCLQVEDLENHSRWHNIRIRGLREPDSTPLTDTVRAIFAQILGRESSADIQLDRVQQALGPQRQDGRPRDVLCCLHAYSLKEALMSATRGVDMINFMGALSRSLQPDPGRTEGSPTPDYYPPRQAHYIPLGVPFQPANQARQLQAPHPLARRHDPGTEGPSYSTSPHTELAAGVTVGTEEPPRGPRPTYRETPDE
ncbi:Hypothetical predicted protein [Pelobates cultripes]|uniref:Uncharacterized protein n=1 Tax=Pelobates cultripes TaxID=61616 RepID=A0AAD1QXD8_PELCU|nr:Hypothetical predicted protein [Pelobates cultripes]